MCSSGFKFFEIDERRVLVILEENTNTTVGELEEACKKFFKGKKIESFIPERCPKMIDDLFLGAAHDLSKKNDWDSNPICPIVIKGRGRKRYAEYRYSSVGRYEYNDNDTKFI